MARRLFSARTLVLGGLAVAAAGAFKNRQKVVGLLGGGGNGPEPYPPPAAAPVGTAAVEHDAPAPAAPISNFDAPGPPENTATHVPAPEPFVHDPHGGIDEAEEEAAAGAEAANIGGAPAHYAGDEDGLTEADEAHRPLEEAGQGVSEGQEQAEAELIDNAEPAAGDPLEGQRSLEDILDSPTDGFAGEIPEPAPQEEPAGATERLAVPPPVGEPVQDERLPDPPAAEAPSAPEPEATEPLPFPPVGETRAEQKSSAVWKSDEEPTQEQPAAPEGDENREEWQGWSDRPEAS